MSASSLPIFRFPSLVTEKILKSMLPLELFCLSTLSARSERVVKAYSKRRQFNVWIKVDIKDQLELRETFSDSTEFKIEFGTGSSNGLALLPDANTLQLCSKDTSKAIPSTLERLSSIFTINSIDAHFKGNSEAIKNNVLDVVKRLKLKIGHYKDFRNEYSFEEVKFLVGSKSLWLEHPKLTSTETKSIFKMSIEKEESSDITLQCEKTPELFGEMANMLNGKPKISSFLSGRRLSSIQDNGRFVSLTVVYGCVSIALSAPFR